MLNIKDIKIESSNLGNNFPKIIITTEHTPNIKYDDIFTVNDDELYFPLIVKSISLTEDILVPIGYRYMYFDIRNSIEELEKIKNLDYRLATEEEQQKIKYRATLL